MKIIDLFCGAGGLTLGFVKNGFNIVESVEIEKNALNTYNYNFKRSEVPKDITNEKIIKNLIEKGKANKVDCIIGGFPCQGYSLAGKRDPNDPRNKLYLYTIKLIEKIKSNFFVLENVKGILSMENGQVIKRIKESLNCKGYYCEYVLLDSSNFGVPQKRERVIFIGSSKKNKHKVNKVIFDLKNHKENIKTVRDAISDLEDKKENDIPNHIFTKHTKNVLAKMSKLKEGESLYSNFSDGWRRIFLDKPSPTVKENHGGVFIHPKFNRCLTPRELARLQSFPDDFVFKSNKSQILKQIGNAVPPKMSYEIAKILIKHFNLRKE